MVKTLSRAQAIIHENERLEEMYRSIMNERKNRLNNLYAHKNKLIDMYLILIKKSAKNKKLVPTLFQKMSDLVKNLYLTGKFTHLNMSKVIHMIDRFINVHSQRCP